MDNTTDTNAADIFGAARKIEVATVIRGQLGRVTLAMLGAMNISAVERADVYPGIYCPGLAFKIRGSRKVNRIEITLSPDDTYAVRFTKVTGGRWSSKRGTVSPLKVATLGQFAGVYVEDLHTLIESETGLVARM